MYSSSFSLDGDFNITLHAGETKDFGVEEGEGVAQGFD